MPFDREPSDAEAAGKKTVFKEISGVIDRFRKTYIYYV